MKDPDLEKIKAGRGLKDSSLFFGKKERFGSCERQNLDKEIEELGNIIISVITIYCKLESLHRKLERGMKHE